MQRFRFGQSRLVGLVVVLSLTASWFASGVHFAEKQRCEKSDFLCYRDHAGLYADFHSFRHMYITSLDRAGISPKMAQTLARHSDIRLTLGVYTHVTVHDQTAAIESLPVPPGNRDEEDQAESDAA
jgi:hypothetical protein